MTRTLTSLLIGAALVASALPCAAQESTYSPKRFTFGLRASVLPWDALQGSSSSRANATPPLEFQYSSTTKNHRVSPGVGIGLHLFKGLSFNADLFMRTVDYTSVTKLYAGTNTSTSGDNRALSQFTDNTKATFWDLPLMFRYQSRASGWTHHIYAEAGSTIRQVSRIRTTNTILDPWSTTTTNRNPDHPVRKRTFGATGGVGLRFVDDFGIVVTPGIRYTYWGGSNLGNDSLKSRRGQAEAGIGFSF